MTDIPLYYYAIIACLVTSLINFQVMREFPYLRYFPAFLFITIIIETIGLYQWDKNDHTTRMYNFFTTFEFFFYLHLLSMIIQSKLVKKILFWSMMVYPVIACLNIMFIIPEDRFHSITYSVGCLLIVTFCVYYFYEVLRFPKSVNLSKEPAFWICSALLFFYCCTFPIYGPANYYNKYPTLIIQNFTSIVSLLNFFLYTLFFIAFLCRIQIRKFIL